MAVNSTESAIDIPPGSGCVKVKIIDICSICNIGTKSLFTPPVPGYDVIASAPSYIFLLEHPSGKKVLFDLGIRKDWENLHPVVAERLQSGTHVVKVEKDIDEFLSEHEINKKGINAVIWSHAHWDHMGNMSLFEFETDLVVGPGFKKQFLDNPNTSPLGAVIPSDIQGRNVHEIAFEPGDSRVVQIGQFPAFDYFQDGSLYLIDSPGHCVGHLCALARTSVNPSSFVFLGGDAAHHCGELRPSRHVPLPYSISPNPLPTKQQNSQFSPNKWFETLQTSRGRDVTGPLYQPAFGHDMDQVLATIAKMQTYDGDDSILVVLAHDAAFRDASVPKFPQAINDWKKLGLGEKFRWTWLGDVWHESQEHASSCCS
ncbi:uncharacterized protein HMPREF1541_07042 [Cyphellophora europaea CBS 101466]|uniref:Metallo-beta-lactamase domain-containing protein n=1 Tax=Cyphellophora europaea (strain CBS 101466) TaxID=1220924 RepID=W2RRQ8_CYPE1|nr:uncharacterized protein HMPREF1541_07042 [Cyphellophora europaea CBS 101466]ETN39000.1 hypothetical protein HMPREF1541_07042 [Cyphellophora europaea CBS 101466]